MDSLQASQETSVEPLDTDDGVFEKSANTAIMADGSRSTDQHEPVSANENNSGSQQHLSTSPTNPAPENPDVEMEHAEQQPRVVDSVDLSTQQTTADQQTPEPSGENSEESPAKKLRGEGTAITPPDNTAATSSSSQPAQQQQPQYYRVSGQIVEPGRIKVFTDPTITQLLGLPSSSFIIPTGNFAAPLIPNSSVSILLPASQLQLYSRAAVEESQMASAAAVSNRSQNEQLDAPAAVTGGLSRTPKIVFKPGMEHTIASPMLQSELSRRLLQQQPQPLAAAATAESMRRGNTDAALNNLNDVPTKANKRGSKRERELLTEKQQQLTKPAKAELNRKQSGHPPQQSSATRDAIRRLASGAALYIQPAAVPNSRAAPAAAAAGSNAQFKKPVTTATSKANTKLARQQAAAAVHSQQARQYGDSAAVHQQQQRIPQNYHSTASGAAMLSSMQYQQQLMTPAADVLCKLNARDIHAVTVQELFDIERRCVSGFKYVNLKQLNGAFVGSSVTGFQNPFMMRQKLQALSRMILNLQPLLIHADLGATLTPPLPLPTPAAVDNAPVMDNADMVGAVNSGEDRAEGGIVNTVAQSSAVTDSETERTQQPSIVEPDPLSGVNTEMEANVSVVTALASTPAKNETLNKNSSISVSSADVATKQAAAAEISPQVAAAAVPVVAADDPASSKAVPTIWTSQLTDRMLQACQIFSNDLESILHDLKRETEQRHSEAIKQQLIQHGSPFMTSLLRGEDVRKYVLKPIGMYDVSVATSNLVRTPSGTANAAYQQHQLLQLQQQQQQQKQIASAGGSSTASATKPHGNSREARERKTAELRAQQLAAASVAATEATNTILRRQQQQLQHQQFMQNFPQADAQTAGGSNSQRGGKKRQQEAIAVAPRRIAASNETAQLLGQAASVWSSSSSPQNAAASPVKSESSLSSNLHNAANKTSPSHRSGSRATNYGLTPAPVAAPLVVTAVTKSGRNIAKPKRFQEPESKQIASDKSRLNGGLHHMAAAAAALSGGQRSRG